MFLFTLYYIIYILYNFFSSRRADTTHCTDTCSSCIPSQDQNLVAILRSVIAMTGPSALDNGLKLKITSQHLTT